MPRLLGVAAVALCAVGLAAPSAAASPVDDRPTAVVSLGDSAISGEGAGDYEPGTRGEGGNWCHRSANALIHRTSAAQRTYNLACSGADASNVSLADTTHYTEGSQARRLVAIARANRVTAVVLQIGANDDPRFADTVLDCVGRWFNPFGAGCAKHLATEWPQRLAAMAPKVERAVADVRTAMREAGYADGAYRFVITSYASPVTEKMDPVQHGPQGCPIRLPDAEYGRTQAVPQFAEAFRGIAARTGLSYLDFSRATEGHEACSGADVSTEWQNRVTVDPWAWVTGGLDAFGIHMAQQSFHPNAQGHAQLGRCLTEFLAQPRTTARCLIGTDGNLHAVR
ncbi:GDSL-type esterase/lipase family protein [Actinokineospora auranticolor]|uniref:GDSL-like lipase/acylhydrolase family protein n=1 Tax=Actinokineospora auranticolor TaxID=155976 RepID=A0A2S6GNF5_9PSEU|nr:GDSL-type esterase/lipase family protein [Actinokineospora auranticolor]PPK66765.1 GDSL-like lipase/acylhydrolase family protein [Actinokineospora auranticolor]